MHFTSSIEGLFEIKGVEEALFTRVFKYYRQFESNCKCWRSSVLKNHQINYFWIGRGQNKFWNNMSFSGYLSLIWSIANRGDWLFSNLQSENNTNTFVDYITELFKWLQWDQKFDMNKIVIVLDNSPIHKSKKSLKHLNKFGWDILYLSAYLPDFAPIELLFNSLKRKLSKQEKGNVVKLNSEAGLRSIIECMASISRAEIVSYWISSMKWVSDVLSKIDLVLHRYSSYWLLLYYRI